MHFFVNIKWDLYYGTIATIRGQNIVNKVVDGFPFI